MNIKDAVDQFMVGYFSTCKRSAKRVWVMKIIKCYRDGKKVFLSVSFFCSYQTRACNQGNKWTG